MLQHTGEDLVRAVANEVANMEGHWLTIENVYYETMAETLALAAENTAMKPIGKALRQLGFDGPLETVSDIAGAFGFDYLYCGQCDRLHEGDKAKLVVVTGFCSSHHRGATVNSGQLAENILGLIRLLPETTR